LPHPVEYGVSVLTHSIYLFIYSRTVRTNARGDCKMSFFNKNDDAQIVEASDWSFKCKIVVTCKIKHLQNICKML